MVHRWTWCVAVLAVSSLAAAAAAPSAGREIGQLAGELLRHPDRSAVADKLRELRVQEAKQRTEALGALVDGLTAYIEGRLLEAAQKLAAVRQSPDIAELTTASLSLPLDKLIKACEGRSSVKGALCSVCGGTGMADCAPEAHGRPDHNRACHGTGWLICRRCDGRGELVAAGPPSRGRRPLPQTRVCLDCNGVGATKCRVCKGKGVIPCVECGGVSRPGDAHSKAAATDAKLREAITRLIAKARHLQRGGIDLETRNALVPSPKLAVSVP